MAAVCISRTRNFLNQPVRHDQKTRLGDSLSLLLENSEASYISQQSASIKLHPSMTCTVDV